MYFLLKIRRCYKSVVKSLMLIKPRIFRGFFFINEIRLRSDYLQLQNRLYPHSIRRTIITIPQKTFSISSPIIIPTAIQNIIKPIILTTGVFPPYICCSILLYYMHYMCHYSQSHSDHAFKNMRCKKNNYMKPVKTFFI